MIYLDSSIPVDVVNSVVKSLEEKGHIVEVTSVDTGDGKGLRFAVGGNTTNAIGVLQGSELWEGIEPYVLKH